MMRQAICTANKNDYPTASYAVAVSDMLFCGVLASFSPGPPHGLEKKCGLKHTRFDITGSFLIGVGYWGGRVLKYVLEGSIVRPHSSFYIWDLQ